MTSPYAYAAGAVWRTLTRRDGGFAGQAAGVRQDADSSLRSGTQVIRGEGSFFGGPPASRASARIFRSMLRIFAVKKASAPA